MSQRTHALRYARLLEENERLVGRVRDLEQALAPFANPRSWHINYDGNGIIFQPDGAYYESQQQAFIDGARSALAASGEEPA